MPDSVIGRRDQNEENWRWLPVLVEEPKPDFGRRSLQRNLLLAAGGAVLTALGIVLLVVFAEGSAGDSRPPSSAGQGAPPFGEGEITTAPPAEVTPLRSPPPIGDVRIFVWSRQDQRWLDSSDVKDEPGYAESETVPVMLQLQGAENGAAYDVTIEYLCRTPTGAAFDYLANVSDERESAILMASPGPVRREDASIPVPDDSAIEFDQPGRRFRAWGASFEGVAEGPLPVGACENTKRVTVRLHAQGPTAYLIWGGHLASEGDWGEGQGASSQSASTYMSVSVNGSETQKVGVAPDAVTP